MKTRIPLITALLATALLVGGAAFAVAASGDGMRDDDDDAMDDHREARMKAAREARENRTDDSRGPHPERVARYCVEAGNNTTRQEQCDRLRDHMERRHPHKEFREKCLAARENATANETANVTAERCHKIREAHQPGHQARRMAHALEGAIAAHERRLARLENLSAELNAQLASAGNATDNETLNQTELEHLIAIVDRHIERTELRLEHLLGTQARLQAKWAEVREWRAEHAREADDEADDASDDVDVDDSDDAEDEADVEAEDAEDEAEDSEEEPEATEPTA